MTQLSTAPTREVQMPASGGVVDLIGNTPLLSFPRIGQELPPGVEVYAKAEWYNPGGSVKDRAGRQMILAAERSGELTPGKTILEATSGNTGIALAMIGAARGYPVKLCLPGKVTGERQRILKAYGAELVLTNPLELTDGAQRMARKLYDEDPDCYFYPDQYSNPNNWLAHYHGTAVEIWEQTGGRVTHWVAGMGTSGTFVGTTRRLREFNAGIQCYSMQPAQPLYLLDGLKHMDTALVPRIYDPSLADADLAIEDEDALEMVGRLAREEGLRVGPSSGAAMACAMRIAKGLTQGVVVTLFPDNADKYLSQPFWDDL